MLSNYFGFCLNVSQIVMTTLNTLHLILNKIMYNTCKLIKGLDGVGYSLKGDAHLC